MSKITPLERLVFETYLSNMEFQEALEHVAEKAYDMGRASAPMRSMSCNHCGG